MFRWLLDLNVPYRQRLIRELEHLAIYNDKGIAWQGHSEAQVVTCRNAHLRRVGFLISRVGENEVPPELLIAAQNGSLAEDGTGQYLELVKKHFSTTHAGAI
jgi:hypothetical protein